MRVYVDSDMMMSQRVIRSLDHHMYPAAQVTKRINKISLIFLVSVRGWCSEHNIASCAGERMVCACDWSMSLYMWLHCTGETCADPCPSSSWGDSYVEECRCDTGMERSVTMWLETVIPADQCHSEGTRYMWMEDVSVKETGLRTVCYSDGEMSGNNRGYDLIIRTKHHINIDEVAWVNNIRLNLGSQRFNNDADNTESTWESSSWSSLPTPTL